MRTRSFRRSSPTFVPRVVAEVNSAALVNNYRAISSLVPGQAVLPMIKADAYGHGAAWAARQLNGMPGLYGFGVATLEEGRDLRLALESQRRRNRIFVFSGTAPWSEEKGQFCERFGLTAVIATDADWREFLKGGWTDRIPYELKFNTGMNRLGLSLALASQVAKALRGKPIGHHPSGILSHLAMGENPEHRSSQGQRERFAALKSELSGVFPSAQFHLANSAAIWNEKLWRLDGLTDAVRPGISLYGVPPWAGAPGRGIEPVLTLKANVATVHRLKVGERVGYGGTYQVKGPEVAHVAILAMGYADGLKRSLSNQGRIWIGEQFHSFVGNISMDLSAVSCPAKTRAGDWAELLGPRIDIWEQALAAGTIPYELLTSLSSRVQRVYD